METVKKRPTVRLNFIEKSRHEPVFIFLPFLFFLHELIDKFSII